MQAVCTHARCHPGSVADLVQTDNASSQIPVLQAFVPLSVILHAICANIMSAGKLQVA